MSAFFLKKHLTSLIFSLMIYSIKLSILIMSQAILSEVYKPLLLNIPNLVGAFFFKKTLDKSCILPYDMSNPICLIYPIKLHTLTPYEMKFISPYFGGGFFFKKLKIIT